jgi:predicted acetyltransferase
MDRAAVSWTMNREPDSDAHIDAWVVRDPAASDRRVLGFVFLMVVRVSDSLHARISITDVAFTTPAAARALLHFLRGFAPLVETASLFGAAAHPLLAHARDGTPHVELDHTYALRIVAVRAALQQRAYPALPLAFALHVTDRVLPNTGVYRVAVRSGAAEVAFEACAEPPADTASLDVTTLASLFSGYASARVLRADGRLSASEEQVAVLDAAFSGPMPICQDYY